MAPQATVAAEAMVGTAPQPVTQAAVAVVSTVVVAVVEATVVAADIANQRVSLQQNPKG